MTNTPDNISKEVNLSELSAFLKSKRGRGKELAAALDIPLPQLSNWLHGRFKPRPEIIEKMASWFKDARQRDEEAKADSAARLRSAINSLRTPNP